MEYTKQRFDQEETQERDLKQIVKPAVSVTVLIFSVNRGKMEVILIKRVRKPFLGMWGLPADIIELDESLEDAARHILEEKTGIKNVYLEQLYTFGNPKRDSRSRVISISYFALIPHNSVNLDYSPDALHAKWTPVETLPRLAFDHEEMIQYAIDRIKNKLEYSNIAHALVPERFRLTELQNIYEIILGRKFDKRNFRKQLFTFDLVESTGQMYKAGNHRPAMLYKFRSRNLVIHK